MCCQPCAVKTADQFERSQRRTGVAVQHVYVDDVLRLLVQRHGLLLDPVRQIAREARIAEASLRLLP